MAAVFDQTNLSDQNLLGKSTSVHCETRFTLIETSFGNFMYWGLKGGISIDADSGPLDAGCDSISHEVFNCIQVGSGHTVSGL